MNSKRLITLLAVMVMLTISAEASSATMTDITSTDTCYEAVQMLQQQKIVLGTGGMAFHPNEAITPDAAALMVCRAFYPAAANSSFEAKKYLIENRLWSKACCNEKTVCVDSAAMLLGAIAKDNWKTYDSEQYFKEDILSNTKYLDQVDPENGKGNLKEALMVGLIPLPQSGVYTENTSSISRGNFSQMLYVLVKNKDQSFLKSEISDRLYSVQWGQVEDLMSKDLYEVNKYLPKKLLRSFTKDEWRVFFVDGSMDKIAGDCYVSRSKLWMHDAEGYTDDTNHYIAINVNIDAKYLLHEFGHYLDYKNGRTSETMVEDESEVEALIKLLDGCQYLRRAKQEYFADAFMEYCLEPEYMRANCPKITAMIETDLANIPDT